MSQAQKRRPEAVTNPVRVLGRGLRAQRGVHLTLRAVREAAGRTQIDIREASRIDQSDISRLEGRPTLDESQLLTIRSYVAALGGRLDLVAVFGDKKIILTGVPAKESSETRANPALQRTGSARR